MSIVSFESLGLQRTRIRQLENLGFTTPTRIQAQAIPQLLAGRDMVDNLKQVQQNRSIFAADVRTD